MTIELIQDVLMILFVLVLVFGWFNVTLYSGDATPDSSGHIFYDAETDVSFLGLFWAVRRRVPFVSITIYQKKKENETKRKTLDPPN